MLCKPSNNVLLVNQTMIGSGKFLSIYDEKLYLFLEWFQFFGFTKVILSSTIYFGNFYFNMSKRESY